MISDCPILNILGEGLHVITFHADNTMVHINVTLCAKLAYNGDGTSLSACIVWRSIDLVSKVSRRFKKLKKQILLKVNMLLFYLIQA